MPKLGMEEIRREQVIAATTRCIVKKGMVDLSVKDIAAEAGVSTGIIYHYFKNKEEILLQVIKATFFQSHQAVMETVEPLKSSRDKLMKHIENINAVPETNPAFYSIMLSYLGQVGSNPQVNKIVAKFLRNLRSYVKGYLSKGEENDFSEDRKAFLPAIVIALGLGIGIMWTVDPKAYDLDEIGEAYKDLIRNYIGS